MHSTQRAKNGEPQPAPSAAQSDAATSKRDLTSWWKQFKRGTPKREEDVKAVSEPHGIFGVPLQDSIKYANVAISLFDEEGNSYIYGYVPIVVAKCGVFLKEKATDVEGIFRLAGSEKRIKELREAFNSPDRYGKGLDWTGYTVHDAANILRRYFNKLPEPIIPLQYYERFRDPLREYVAQTTGPDGTSSQLWGSFDVETVIRVYQKLITEIPPLNRQLLLYILDLLAVFAAKSDQNKMTTQNLAAIFQPGILNHPQHDMSPDEYRLSQTVLVFLIENQDHFLVGMRGTAADAQTIQEVQSGGAAAAQRGSTTPTRSKTTSLGRSPSNGSAGADSVRRYGGVRRNVSVSSRNSRNSVTAPSPVTPSFSGGVHRSNTVPSKKSPAIQSARFSRDRPSDPPTPATPSSGLVTQLPLDPDRLQPPTPAPPELMSPSSDDSTPLASEVNPINSAVSTPEKLRPQPGPVQQLSPARAVSGEADNPPLATPASGTRSFSNIFIRSVSQDSEKKDGRKPNKLQKKRAPGSANPSAHSSTQSLTGVPSDAPPSPLPSDMNAPSSAVHAVPRDPVVPPPIAEAVPSRGDSLKPSMSPSASFHSHSTVTDYSELEHGEETPVATETVEKEKKRRWRFSNHKHNHDKTSAQGDSSLGLNAGAQQSVSSVSSAGERGRRSFNVNRPPFSPETLTAAEPGNGTPARDEKGKHGPIDWFKGKLAERKAEKERAKSPPEKQIGSGPGSRSSLHLGRPREEQERRGGRSMDIPRRVETDPQNTPTQPKP